MLIIGKIVCVIWLIRRPQASPSTSTRYGVSVCYMLNRSGGLLPNDGARLRKLERRPVPSRHLFAERLGAWRKRNLGDELAFRAARGDAQRRFPLNVEEVVQDGMSTSRAEGVAGISDSGEMKRPK